MAFAEEFNQLVQRAEVIYALLLIGFLLAYIAFARHPHNQKSDRKN